MRDEGEGRREDKTREVRSAADKRGQMLGKRRYRDKGGIGGGDTKRKK